MCSTFRIWTVYGHGSVSWPVRSVGAPETAFGAGSWEWASQLFHVKQPDSASRHMEVERRSAGTPGTGTSVPGPVSLSLADPTAARPRPPRVPSELPGHFQPPGVTFPRPAGREGSASLLCQCCTLQAQSGSLRPSAPPRTGRASPSMRARPLHACPGFHACPGAGNRDTGACFT